MCICPRRSEVTFVTFRFPIPTLAAWVTLSSTSGHDPVQPPCQPHLGTDRYKAMAVKVTLKVRSVR